VTLAVACFSLLPTASAVTPAPDGGYFNANTAEGTDALFSLTTGVSNTAIGFHALFNNQTSSYNTAIGTNALVTNTTGESNTAIGFLALDLNTSGNRNTATGDEALYHNRTGSYNTAAGAQALFSNQDGGVNLANGYSALQANVSGFYNVASGAFALGTNTGGSFNAATGANALYYNKGSNNTANGHQALQNNTTGNNNVALGFQAGLNLTGGSNNIVIGAGVTGLAGEANTTRIGKSSQAKTLISGIYNKTVASGTRVGVMIDSTGKLGTVVSSARYKEAIKPMNKASEAILGLRPVTFRYKHELDPDGIPQFGLIAEQVEKVNPDLVVRDEDGKVNTVRYEAVNAMLLNEFLKEHRQVQELKGTVAQQQKQIEALTTGLQKVAAQVESGKLAARIAISNQ
jgi:hypothetical protein